MSLHRLFAMGVALGAASLASSSARAKDVDCLLEVDGKKFIDGVCRMTPGEHGGFELGTFGPSGDLQYLAIVSLAGPGRAEGFWNEARGAARARTPLGALAPAGACWTNAHARVCAWKIGEPRYFVDASDGAVPKRVGQCVSTQIASLGSRLEGAPDSGSAVSYTNGIVGVSYETVEAVRRSRVGDLVTLCLVSVPSDCPKGDDRGKVYSAVNKRTGQGWSLPDAEHMCGGA